MASVGAQGLGDRLARALAARLGVAQVSVTGLARISGGASRETYRFVLRAGEGPERRLILRRDPAGSLIETDRGREFAALEAFHGSDVPVPEPLWLEADAGPLGAPFFVMAEITGAEPNPLELMRSAWQPLHPVMAREKWTTLGRIARSDAAVARLRDRCPPVGVGGAWAHELAHWEKVLDADELEPMPIARAALRWMKRHPPLAARRLSVVHGDYRTGNLLFRPSGEIAGVLDWEMVHVGDPLEDLAWGLNRVWCFRPDLAGGLAPRAEAIALWEQASGLVADPSALHWWELFSCIKGQAIWISAAAEFVSGRNRDLIMPIAAWSQQNAQDRAILELMGH